MIWVGSSSIYGVFWAMALHVSVLEPKVLTFAISRHIEILKKYLLYIVSLKCYQTSIQYLVILTLSLVVISRHDKKLTRLGAISYYGKSKR